MTETAPAPAAPLTVHVVFEYGPDGLPFGSSHVRLLRPLSHPRTADRVRVSFGAGYGGDPVDVVVCRDQDEGRVAGVGACAHHALYVNGVPRHVGYLFGLRARPEYMRTPVLHRGYAFLHEHHAATADLDGPECRRALPLNPTPPSAVQGVKVRTV